MDWLRFADCLRRAGLHGMQAYPALKFHVLFVSSTPSAWRFPRHDYEAHVETTLNMSVLRTYAAGLPPALRASAASLLTERIPSLLQIVQPNVRVPNRQLLRSHEVTALERLVAVMAAEGLTWRSERTAEGLLCYVLDPPLDRVACRATVANAHENAVRQMIAHEVGLARILAKRHPVATAKREAKPLVPPKIKVQRNFFSRPMPVAEVLKAAPVVRVWYKYNEGFSNAVRRTLRMRDLFPDS